MSVQTSPRGGSGPSGAAKLSVVYERGRSAACSRFGARRAQKHPLWCAATTTLGPPPPSRLLPPPQAVTPRQCGSVGRARRSRAQGQRMQRSRPPRLDIRAPRRWSAPASPALWAAVVLALVGVVLGAPSESDDGAGGSDLVEDGAWLHPGHRLGVKQRHAPSGRSVHACYQATARYCAFVLVSRGSFAVLCAPSAHLPGRAELRPSSSSKKAADALHRGWPRLVESTSFCTLPFLPGLGRPYHHTRPFVRRASGISGWVIASYGIL